MGEHRDPERLISQLAREMFRAMPDTDDLTDTDRIIIERIIARSNSRRFYMRLIYFPVCLRWRTRVSTYYQPKHSERKHDGGT